MLLSNLNSSGISPGYFWQVAAAWAVSMLTAFGFLWFAKFTVLSQAVKRPLVPQTLVVFAVAFVLRAVSFDLTVVASGASEHLDFGYRLAASVPTFGIGLLICAYIVSLAREFSRNRIHLSAVRDETEQLSVGVAERAARHRVELLDGIQQTLRRNLDAALSDSPPAALHRMRAVIEEVVRPVSRRLIEGLSDVAGPAVPDGQTVNWASVFRHVLDANPIRPVLFAVWVSGAALALSIVRMPLGTVALFSATVCVVAFLGLSLLRGGWRLVPQRARGWYFSLGIIAVALIVNWAVWAIPGQPPLLFAYGAISLGIAWLIAVVSSLSRACEVLRLEVAQAELGLRAATVMNNTHLREQRLAIAQVLHGPVQDSILVASFQLANAIAAGVADERVLGELSALMSLALDEIAAPQLTPADIHTAVGSLAKLWSGVVEIQAEVDERAAESLREHPASSHTVAEIVREACSNAIRHGSAEHVRVRVAMGAGTGSSAGTGVGADAVEVEVWNDGQPLSAEVSTGVGTLLLDELTLNWQRSMVQGSTLLRAVVPLVRLPPPLTHQALPE